MDFTEEWEFKAGNLLAYAVPGVYQTPDSQEKLTPVGMLTIKTKR